MTATTIKKRGTKKEVWDRSCRIIELLAQGLSSKQIAADLGVSVNTATAYRTSLILRHGLHNTAQLINYAYQSGILEVTPKPKP